MNKRRVWVVWRFQKRLVPFISDKVENISSVAVFVLLHGRQRVNRIIVQKRIHASLPYDIEQSENWEQLYWAMTDEALNEVCNKAFVSNWFLLSIKYTYFSVFAKIPLATSLEKSLPNVVSIKELKARQTFTELTLFRWLTQHCSHDDKSYIVFDVELPHVTFSSEVLDALNDASVKDGNVALQHLQAEGRVQKLSLRLPSVS